MAWSTPRIEEICIGMEINGYFPPNSDCAFQAFDGTTGRETGRSFSFQVHRLTFPDRTSAICGCVTGRGSHAPVSGPPALG